jgi:hypothetical protein
MRRLVFITVCFLCLHAFSAAELSGKDRKEAETMVKGTLYLRIDAPCKYGYGGFGLSVKPLVEVSPTGYRTESTPITPTKKKESVYWGFGPNDAVRYGKLSVKGEVDEVWLEGVPPNDNEVIVQFVQIKTLDDFKAAFNQAFSTVPLQEEHPEWPAEIRKAIAERRVVEGMTKKQAFAVVGAPINVLTGTENGAETETWFPRQEKGTLVTFRKLRSTATGFPAQLKFVDGKLVAITKANQSPEVKLDK